LGIPIAIFLDDGLGGGIDKVSAKIHTLAVLARPSQNKLIWFSDVVLLFVEEWRQNRVFIRQFEFPEHLEDLYRKCCWRARSRLVYGGCAYSTRGGCQNIAVLTKRYDNSFFLRS